MTKLQRCYLRRVWYRAARSGERVTLASLYRAGALKRRAWRGSEGERDAAYEYQLMPMAEQALRTLAPGEPTALDAPDIRVFEHPATPRHR